LQFIKGESTNDRAVFNNVVMRGSNGDSATLDNLVITRNNVPGPKLGQFTISIDKFSDGDSTRIGRVTVNGIRGGENLLTILKTFTQLSPRRPLASALSAPVAPAFAEAVSISDMVTTVADNQGPMVLKVGQLNMTNVTFDTKLKSFDMMSMSNGDFDYLGFSAKFDEINLSGITPEQIYGFAPGAPPTTFDPYNFTLGRLSINNLVYKFKSENSQQPPLNTMAISNFTIENMKDGFIGQFSLSGLKIDGGVGTQAWEMGLNRFNVGGVNMRYFAEYAAALQMGFVRDAPEPSTPPSSAKSSEPDDATIRAVEAAAAEAVYAGAAAEAAEAAAGGSKRAAAPARVAVKSPPLPAPMPRAPSPPRPRVLMGDLLKGGPLEGGMRSFGLSGFSVSAAGFDFTIDQMGVTQVRDSADIVTKAEIIPSLVRFSWPTETDRSRPNPLVGSLNMLGTDHIAMRFSGSASFSPQTDRLSFDAYDIEVIDWGKVKIGFALSGIRDLMSKVTMSELFSATSEMGTSAGSRAAAGTPPRTAQSATAQNIFKRHGNVTLNSGRVEIFDLGGLDRVATIMEVMSQGSPSRRPTVTAAQKKRVRDGWASAFRQSSGDKSKPEFERQFSIVMARWLEAGGSFMVELNPATPLAISALIDESPPAISALGLRVTSGSPVAPARR
jgi:hypothetical protein